MVANGIVLVAFAPHVWDDPYTVESAFHCDADECFFGVGVINFGRKIRCLMCIRPTLCLTAEHVEFGLKQFRLFHMTGKEAL